MNAGCPNAIAGGVLAIAMALYLLSALPVSDAAER